MEAPFRWQKLCPGNERWDYVWVLKRISLKYNNNNNNKKFSTRTLVWEIIKITFIKMRNLGVNLNFIIPEIERWQVARIYGEI